MGESEGGVSISKVLKQYWEGWSGFWCDRFAFLDNHTRFLDPQNRLPSWTESDVDAFIAIDPVHGPVLKTVREAVKICFAGTAVGALSTAGFAWKYSRSPHGALLAFGAGAVFGWTFGQEVANHTYQLYRLDTMGAQVKFLEWWELKSQGKSL